MLKSPKYFSLVIFLTIYKTIKKDKMIFDKQTEKLYHCIHIFINRKKVSNDIFYQYHSYTYVNLNKTRALFTTLEKQS